MSKVHKNRQNKVNKSAGKQMEVNSRKHEGKARAGSVNESIISGNDHSK